ncbi:unnamed protein product [Phytophthora fragariaefolia]|uniref:Unnamed protein product n=1 Tax=Phytophthora fragariaefolia TaxID=1490495 RepID=A0A9W6XKQ4_9STRA|nr:unnamed protein product [Phytophthora fragariaefolia]
MQASEPGSGLTTEHIKSHLQKYRVNYERSRREFQELCDREVKRNRKRRRQEKSGSAYIFPLRSARDRNDSSRNETDSDSECEENPSGSADPDEQQVKSFVSSPELGDTATAFAAQNYPVGYPGYLQVQQAPDQTAATPPELTDVQWQTFCSLMFAPPPTCGSGIANLSIQAPQPSIVPSPQQALNVVEEDLQIQMREAMQAQMNLHRRMLTRKVALSHDLNRMESLEASRYPGYSGVYGADTLEPIRFDQTWVAPQQQPLASHVQQQRQYEATQQPMPPEVCGDGKQNTTVSSFTSSQAELVADTKPDDVGDDPNRWDPFNVDLDGDDLFDFLRA